MSKVRDPSGLAVVSQPSHYICYFKRRNCRTKKISRKLRKFLRDFIGRSCRMVYSGLNSIFSIKYTVFLLTFQNVLFYYQNIKLTLKKDNIVT